MSDVGVVFNHTTTIMLGHGDSTNHSTYGRWAHGVQWRRSIKGAVFARTDTIMLGHGADHDVQWNTTNSRRPIALPAEAVLCMGELVPTT